ncbi:Crp/Fnr family transcriptional regulator [Algoriphagus pacificus]|uniref:Crp/Fnr family transcriptional regulator n=1 Tax=Algoriphagus pacificus TaxID=2811234 RepID=A0ABS3CNI7_9BACT|nr:Crp/Fnr family transcriptional regulator [Algoriphagus pacificus]MBN7818021.1 Crp/Fnr family transcriptional regulator [Algoriphagus pacificus]
MISSQKIQPEWNQEASFPDFKLFQKGCLIYKQGITSEGYYLLKKGTVKLQKSLDKGSQTILRIVSEGEIFGEGDFYGQNENQSTAIAIEDDTIIQKLDAEKTKIPEVNQQVQLHLLNQNEHLATRLQRMLFEEAEERIKSLLFDLASKKGKNFGTETLLKINLTHSELALLADTSRQMVSKTLSQLKKEGQLNYSRNRFLFRNLLNFKPQLS